MKNALTTRTTVYLTGKKKNRSNMNLLLLRKAFLKHLKKRSYRLSLSMSLCSENTKLKVNFSDTDPLKM